MWGMCSTLKPGRSSWGSPAWSITTDEGELSPFLNRPPADQATRPVPTAVPFPLRAVPTGTDGYSAAGLPQDCTQAGLGGVPVLARRGSCCECRSLGFDSSAQRAESVNFPHASSQPPFRFSNYDTKRSILNIFTAVLTLRLQIGFSCSVKSKSPDLLENSWIGFAATTRHFHYLRATFKMILTQLVKSRSGQVADKYTKSAPKAGHQHCGASLIVVAVLRTGCMFFDCRFNL